MEKKGRTKRNELKMEKKRKRNGKTIIITQQKLKESNRICFLQNYIQFSIKMMLNKDVL